jgi:hypothetical protein
MRRLLLHGWLVWLLSGGGALAALAQPGWLPGFHPPGLNGRVAAVVVQANGDLIAGGEFTNADGHPTADYVARWDGHAWQALGEGPGHFSHLSVLQRLPNGHLLAAGIVASDSAKTYSMVTRWDGRHWQPLGAAKQDGWLTAVAVAPNGDILAAIHTQRALCGVMRWNGHNWQPLTPNPPANKQQNKRVIILGHLVVTSAGDIVGSFGGGDPYHTSVARWNGTDWQPLGPPAQGHRTAEALTLTPSGEVLAGGVLTDDRSYWTKYVARWDGRTWQNLGLGPTGNVERLVVSPTGEVLATTSVSVKGPYYTRLSGIERWNGTRWQPLTPTSTGREQAQAALAVGANGTIIGPGPLGLARWDGHAWHALASEPQAGFTSISSTQVSALAAASGGKVFLAGSFYNDAASESGVYQFRTQVHYWDGRRRRLLGPDFAGQIAALAVAPNGDVLAAGSFAIANGADSIRYIARWNGHRWCPLGKGPPAATLALAVASNGDVLVGGSFGLSRWNGRRWQPQALPSLPESSGQTNAPAVVTALAVAPTGDILAGGRFAGPNPYHDISVMRWNGNQWQPMAGHVEPFVNSLAVAADGKVVVGTGATSQVHDHNSNSGTVVRSDTAATAAGWEHFGEHFDGYVNAVAIAANGDIIAGGDFSTADYTTPAHSLTHSLARWHDGAWQPLGGSGVNGTVRALVVAPNGDIIVGGEFTATGDGAQSLGQWGIYRDR